MSTSTFRSLTKTEIANRCRGMTDLQVDKLRKYNINCIDDDLVKVTEPPFQLKGKLHSIRKSCPEQSCATCSLEDWDPLKDPVEAVRVVDRPVCVFKMVSDKWRYLGQIREVPSGSWSIDTSNHIVSTLQLIQKDSFVNYKPYIAELLDMIFDSLSHYFR